jgi:hypothetical protein
MERGFNEFERLLGLRIKNLALKAPSPYPEFGEGSIKAQRGFGWHFILRAKKLKSIIGLSRN